VASGHGLIEVSIPSQKALAQAMSNSLTILFPQKILQCRHLCIAGKRFCPLPFAKSGPDFSIRFLYHRLFWTELRTW
jgi:hypothetical protein